MQQVYSHPLAVPMYNAHDSESHEIIECSIRIIHHPNAHSSVQRRNVISIEYIHVHTRIIHNIVLILEPYMNMVLFIGMEANENTMIHDPAEHD